MTEQGVGWRDYVDMRLCAIEKAIVHQREVQQIALDRANEVNEYRLAMLNEFRGAMTNQQATYVTRAEFDAKFKGLSDDVDAIKRIVFVGLGIVLAFQFAITIFGNQIFG